MPIIPAFLYQLHHERDMIILNESYLTSTPSPAQEWNRRIDQSVLEKSQLLYKLGLSSSQRQKLPFLSSQCEKEVSVKGRLN